MTLKKAADVNVDGFPGTIICDHIVIVKKFAIKMNI